LQVRHPGGLGEHGPGIVRGVLIGPHTSAWTEPSARRLPYRATTTREGTMIQRLRIEPYSDYLER